MTHGKSDFRLPALGAPLEVACGGDRQFLMIFEASRSIGVPVAKLDIVELRRVYSALFDEAADAVTKSRLDLDDVTIERFLDCAMSDGDKFTVKSPPLADADRLSAAIRSAMRAYGPDTPSSCVAIIGANVCVVKDANKAIALSNALPGRSIDPHRT